MRLVSRRPLVPPARTERVPRARGTLSSRRDSIRTSASKPPRLPPIPDAIIDDAGDVGSIRFVLVRHGQSTWNAEGRIQGSSDISVLTEKGKRQARDAAELLSRERFDAMAHSPLSRAAETASIIWTRNESAAIAQKENKKGGGLAAIPLASLREIDLHSFQGLLKSDVNGGSGRSGGGVSGGLLDAYLMWKNRPEDFELDGRAPVRDLWERAEREAWRELFANLLSERSNSSSSSPSPRFLVVAHNAVNQALVSVALGFPSRAFRRLVQSNGCVTELALSRRRNRRSSSDDGVVVGEGKEQQQQRRQRRQQRQQQRETLATVLRLNVGPCPPLKRPAGVALVVFVSVGGRGNEEGEEGEGGGASSPSSSSPSLARALFGARGGSSLSDAPIVLSGEGEANKNGLLASAEAAGFEREALERARVFSSSSSSSSSAPPASSFWRASAAAAASSPCGIAVSLGTQDEVERALAESLGDLTCSSAAAHEEDDEEEDEEGAPPPLFSAPAGGVSVVEVDIESASFSSLSSSSPSVKGTIRCTNWRPVVRREEANAAAAARGAGAVAA